VNISKFQIMTWRARGMSGHFRLQAGIMGLIIRALHNQISCLDTGAWGAADDAVVASLKEKLRRLEENGPHLQYGLENLAITLSQVARVLKEADEDVATAFTVIALPWEAGTWAPRSLIPKHANPSLEGIPVGAALTYGLPPGRWRLFVQGEDDPHAIHPSDVRQGQLGNCYFVSSLAALANTEKGRVLIQSHMTANKDGTYTVTLYEYNRQTGTFEEIEIVVTPDLPSRPDGSPAFAHPGDIRDGQQEYWVQIYEKAYAQYRGGYSTLDGGAPHTTLATLTGVPSESLRPSDMTFDRLQSHAAAGDVIVVTSLPDSDGMCDREWRTPISGMPDANLDISLGVYQGTLQAQDGHVQLDVNFEQAWETNPLYTGPDAELITNHVYYVIDVDYDAEGRKMVHIKNPHSWETETITMTWEEFQGAFQDVAINPISQ
jgi:hypothetical protein